MDSEDPEMEGSMRHRYQPKGTRCSTVLIVTVVVLLEIALAVAV